MWLAYGEREELAGVSLQKQKISVYGEENLNADIAGLVDSPVFLYELSGIGGAVGMSPHPHHWAQFISQYGGQMSTCPPGLQCADSDIWEPWWFYYTLKTRLFTLYLAHPLTMTTQHREKGVHEKAEDTEKDFDFISEWENSWEKQNLPSEIPRLGLNLEPVSDTLHQAKKIHDKHGIVIVTMLGYGDVNHLPYSYLNPHDRVHLLDQTLYIVPTPLLLPNLLHLPHLAVEKPHPALPKNLTADQPQDQL